MPITVDGLFIICFLAYLIFYVLLMLLMQSIVTDKGISAALLALDYSLG